MTPTAQTVTLTALNVKSNGCFAKGKMLMALKGLTKLKAPITHELEVAFDRAYRAIDEVSDFPVDTDPKKNLDMDADELKLKVDNAVTKTAELKVKLGSTNSTDKADAEELTEAKELVDHVVSLIMQAHEDAETLVRTSAAIKAGEEIRRAPEA